MNQFSDSLLTALLSWLRMLFSSFLSLLQGEGSGFFAWMSGRWFLLALVLVMGGLALDLIIYMLRWHPQNVWRTRLRRLFGRRAHTAEDRAFAAGYNTALPEMNLYDSPVEELQQQPVPQYTKYDLMTAPETGENATGRRRRSARYSRRAARSAALIRFPEFGENARASAQTPPVNAREAFYEPIYPTTPPPPQQQPWPENQNGGEQAYRHE